MNEQKFAIRQLLKNPRFGTLEVRKAGASEEVERALSRPLSRMPEYGSGPAGLQPVIAKTAQTIQRFAILRAVRGNLAGDNIVRVTHWKSLDRDAPPP